MAGFRQHSSVLDFKARALGVDSRIPRLGSLPHLDRAGLIRKALEGCPGPHLYVGDRPHDRDAALSAGVPFLGVGEAVPGEHPILSAQASRGGMGFGKIESQYEFVHMPIGLSYRLNSRWNLGLSTIHPTPG